MKTRFLLLLLVVLTGCSTVPAGGPAVRLELRPGSLTPGPGLHEATILGSSQKVYLSDQVLISNGDVAAAKVEMGAYGPEILLRFTRDGTARFSAATEQCLNQPIGILVDGQVYSAPIVREKITGGRAMITGSFTAAEAERIAAGLRAR